MKPFVTQKWVFVIGESALNTGALGRETIAKAISGRRIYQGIMQERLSLPQWLSDQHTGSVAGGMCLAPASAR